MRKLIIVLLLSISMILSGCQSIFEKSYRWHKNDIIVSNGHEIFKLSSNFKKVTSIYKQRRSYFSSIMYNAGKGSIMITSLPDNQIIQLNKNGVFKYGTPPSSFADSSGRYIVMSNDEIYADSKGAIQGKWSIFDLKKKKSVYTERIYGDFRNIITYKNKAYITTYGDIYDKKSSNIYEVDLKKVHSRPIFKHFEAWAPHVILDEQGHPFGLYTHWDFGTINQLTNIDMKSGKTKLIADLAPYVWDGEIVGKYAVIIHYDENGTEIKGNNHISIVNLETKKIRKIENNDIGDVFDIVRYGDEVLITDLNGRIHKLNPTTGDMESRMVDKEGLLHITTVN
ncbi:hypothetical protein [Marininema halotolerans]|uniref:Uncharacterized protein n=1 Tax=Marininema halotolerans TaxID=1155944 RepID=A0A1I6NXK6_9BACL|nr:hypothetical protein [Marininema halotolerans]SFS32654.1 hypothetical protein SAMN05444972_101217 [Marininema halotolerans]